MGEQYAAVHHDAEKLTAENEELRKAICEVAQQQAALASDQPRMCRSSSPQGRLQALAHMQNSPEALNLIKVPSNTCCTAVDVMHQQTDVVEHEASSVQFVVLFQHENGLLMLHERGWSECGASVGLKPPRAGHMDLNFVQSLGFTRANLLQRYR